MFRAPLVVLLVSSFAIGGVIVNPTPAQADTGPSILINEFANGGPRSDSDSFFELRNWGDEAVDLTGWHVYRCSWQGLRSNTGRPEAELGGIVLDPGEIFTVSRAGMPGDAHFTQPLAASGFGLYLEGPDARRVDAVGVYPNQPWPTQSECTVGRNLTNTLDFAAGESWQRTSPTDFVKAPATIGAANATAEARRETTGVQIAELAGSGPAAPDDEFVELVNSGSSPQNIGGWQVFRCTAGGRLRPDTLETTIAAGTVLKPGERWVAAGAGFTGEADGALGHSLGNVEFGVLVRSAAGRLVDRLAVSNYGDSACQDGDDKLPAVLDPVAGESYQRVGGGFVVAERTPDSANRAGDTGVFGQDFSYPDAPAVAISELATDPTPEGMPEGSVQRNYIELGNYGTAAADIGGWTVRRCEADGQRSRELQFAVPEGTTLEPGDVFLAAREGTEAAGSADIGYATSLNFLGTGVWLADARGRRVDSVGVYAANEMDASHVTPSPCTLGMSLTTYQPDRLLAETFQRTRFTGSNADDFVTRPETPGAIDSVAWVDPTAYVASAAPASLDLPVRQGAQYRARATVPSTVLEAWAGVTDGAPLEQRVGPAESALAVDAPAPVADDGFGYPYQRFVLDASTLAAGIPVSWSGSTSDRDEVQLSVWSAAGWRLLQAGSGENVVLSGRLQEGDIVDGAVTLLAQDGPRTATTLATGRDGELENPEDYDFAITHITDTQYLSESYPEVYAQLASWVADNADDRKIAFATHTGDLVQNWVDPDQGQDRARVEFQRASDIQSILDDAGVPNSVLPGNHDNKRGVDDSLFNEYFPPSRYDGNSWYGGSIAPADNSANFSTFERSGANFLMLSLPYAYGDNEIAWASDVVTSHPGYNVIVSTHEHVMPKTLEESAHRSTNSRWVSRGQQLWDDVIAPNRNVVAVLSGHFHGLGQLVTENAGGIAGHTVVELLADYQEFRTHTGERATGFFRMLQLDLDAETIAVDTRSLRLAAAYSLDYDYRQFLPDNGLVTSPSNARPWRVIESGVQGRYSEEDDEFTASVVFQHPKSVATEGLFAG